MLFPVQTDHLVWYLKLISMFPVLKEELGASLIPSVDESHMFSLYSNKLLVYNDGFPKTRMNNPNVGKFAEVVEHTL